MNPIDAIKKAAGNLFQPQQQNIISPLAGSDTLNTPGLQYYAAQQVARQQPQPPSNFQPKTLQYPNFQAPVQSPTPTQAPADNSPLNNIKGALGQLLQLHPNQQPQANAAVIGGPNGASNYELQAAPIFQKYGIPPEAGLGIWAMEGRGKTINPNNPYNLGAFDSNPQNANAFPFKNPIEGTEEAAKFLTGQSKYQTDNVKKIFQTAIDQYKKTGDQMGYLKSIAPTYSSNPAWTQTILQTPEFQRWAYSNQ